MKKPLAAAAAGVLLVLPLAACGSQSDQRVSDDVANASPSAVASAVPSAVPSVDASVAASVASAVASATPFVSVDCVSGQVMPNDAPPSNGATIGGVTASLQPTGVPTITIATDAQPATELGVADIQEGTGAEAQAGDTLTVNYCGVGLGGKTLFDSSWTRGTPATFGLSQVIQGWQQGVPGMKVGGYRLLVIPGELAYGDAPPDGAGIAPNETLIFVVQLTAIGGASPS